LTRSQSSVKSGARPQPARQLLGEQQPQAHNAPTYRTSAGPEAIALSKSAGLILDPWQASFLTDSLAEDDDGNWAAFECGLLVSRQNGKGSALEARILAGLNLFGEKMILWSAHETKTSFEAFRRCEQLFDGSTALRKQVKAIHRANGNESIELRNGARLRFVARTKGSGRGFSADLIILDEAYALTSEQMAALIPTLASRANPQIFYTSSPPLDGMSGDQLYALRERAAAGDPALTWYDYGLQGVNLEDLDKVDLDDPENWRRTNPAMGYRISEDFVRRERRTMPAVDFARERLGVWPRRLLGGSAVIDEKLWQDMADRVADRPADVAFAVDINPARTSAAVAVVGVRPDGSKQLMLADYRGGNTDWIPARLAELKQAWNPIAIGIDVKGPAGSLILDLEKVGITVPQDPDRPRRGDLAVPTASEAAAAFGLFVDAVRQRQLWHADDKPMNLALAGAKTRSLAGGSAWDRKADTDISPLVAATVAHWAFLTRVDAVSGSYDPLSNIW
jgi:hypothetical protein